MSHSPPRHLRLAIDASEQEPVSFEAAFRRWAPYIGGVVTRILGPGTHVDDVVQDVFVDAYRAYDRLRDQDALRPWLTTIAVRRARRALKRRRLRRFIGLDAVSEIPDTYSMQPERRVQLVAVYRVLDRMDAESRIAWVLRHVQGETLLEVARLCDCSRATAHRRISKVADALAKEFRDVL